MKPLNADELKQWFDRRKSFYVLDVREPWEFEIVRLPNARLIPLRQLRPPLPDIPADQPVVVYCHHGTRSLIAAKMLEKSGFAEVYNLKGGIHQYALRADIGLSTY
jgi:rhodanese-related sulfurtransferase